MTISRSLTSITVAATLAASAVGPMATAASAHGWHGGNRGYHVTRHAPRRYWRGHRHHRHYGYRYRKRDKTGKYIAIGLGAFMLGIIAAQAHRPYYD